MPGPQVPQNHDSLRLVQVILAILTGRIAAHTIRPVTDGALVFCGTASMDRLAPMRREFFPRHMLSRGWRISSFLTCGAAILLFAIIYAAKTHKLETFGAFVAAASLVFCVLILLHARFLYLARQQQRQTSTALDATERELEEERQRWEISLHESEARFQQMANNIQEVFWMIDAGTRRIVYVNQAYESITGRSRQGLREDPFSYEELIHPDDRARVIERLEKATQTGRFNDTFRIGLPNGEIRWIWARGFPVRGVDGTVLRLVGTALEVTAQHEAEEQVARNLALAESAWAEADAMRKATLALTQDLRMDSVLDTLLRSLAELVPYTCARVLIPEGGPHVLALAERQYPEPTNKLSEYPLTLNADKSAFLQRILANQTSVLISDTRGEEGWQTFSGHEHLRCWLSVPLLGAKEYLGLLSVGHRDPDHFTQEHLRRAQLLAIPAAVAIQNARLYERAEIYGEELERRVSDLRDAKQALEQSEVDRRASEDRFQTIFRSSPIAFSVTTLVDGRYLDVNEAFERRYGYTRTELLGRTSREIGIWNDPTERIRLVEQLRHGRSIRNAVTRLRTKSGELIVTAYSAECIQLDGQTCLLVVSEDVMQPGAQRCN